MKIHWVGGQLPKVGKSWTARALIEGLYLDRGIQVVTIDTSYGSPLSKLAKIAQRAKFVHLAKKLLSYSVL